MAQNPDENPVDPTAKKTIRRRRFTDVGIRALKAIGGRRTDYSDIVQRGLRLRVGPNGERTFLLAYTRPRDGRRTKLRIGPLSERMTLAQARKEAADMLALLRREPPIDPAEERARRREAAKAASSTITFAKACEAFIVEELPALKKSTRDGWRGYIGREIVPALGPHRPEDITAEHIAAMRSSIERGIPGPTKKGKATWKRKPAPSAARKVFKITHRILEWLCTPDHDVAHARKRHGLHRLDHNPAVRANKFRRKSGAGRRTRAEAATKAYTDDQLRAVYAATERTVESLIVLARVHRPAWRREGTTRGAAAELFEARAYANLLDLVAHTVVRSHDARAARWSEFDDARRIWTIPFHKMSEVGGPHVVPLTDATLRILARIRETNMAAGYGTSEWLFPGAAEADCDVCDLIGHLDKTKRLTARLKAAAGIIGRGLLHRLRDTVKTRMSEHGIDGAVSEAILAHSAPGILGTYDHAVLLPQRRAALDWWAGELARILDAKEAAAGA